MELKKYKRKCPDLFKKFFYIRGDKHLIIEKLAYILGETQEWISFQIENNTYSFVLELDDGVYEIDSRSLEYYLFYGPLDLDFRRRSY